MACTHSLEEEGAACHKVPGGCTWALGDRSGTEEAAGWVALVPAERSDWLVRIIPEADRKLNPIAQG